jgi:hypothetical protein
MARTGRVTRLSPHSDYRAQAEPNNRRTRVIRELEMSSIDEIAEQRRRYMASAKTSRDWFDYVTAVERLRKLAPGRTWPDKQPKGGTPLDRMDPLT